MANELVKNISLWIANNFGRFETGMDFTDIAIFKPNKGGK